MANLTIPRNVKLTVNSNSKLVVPFGYSDIFSHLTDEQIAQIQGFTPQISFSATSTTKTLTILNYNNLIEGLPSYIVANNLQIGLIIAKHHNDKKRKNVLQDLVDSTGTPIYGATVSWRGISISETQYLTFSIDENSHFIVTNNQNEEEDIFNIIKPDPNSRAQDHSGSALFNPHDHYYFGIVFRVIDRKSKRFIKTNYSPDCIDVPTEGLPSLLSYENISYRYHN